MGGWVRGRFLQQFCQDTQASMGVIRVDAPTKPPTHIKPPLPPPKPNAPQISPPPTRPKSTNQPTNQPPPPFSHTQTKQVLDQPFDAGTAAPPHSLAWCGPDSLVLHWRHVGLLMVRIEWIDSLIHPSTPSMPCHAIHATPFIHHPMPRHPPSGGALRRLPPLPLPGRRGPRARPGGRLRAHW